ncbi:hypothetical protein F4808DRAFT_422365 [Astrocystis sublimbata]|nr:hypothetical protein F4808DRAFT_422365 [Astrocystis sublimbata]
MLCPATMAALADEAPAARGRAELDGDISPRHPAVQPTRTASNELEPLAMRADPDASATVTDFLDFTEHLPSDLTRSLTLIAQLDRSYIDSSAVVNELTTTWGKLPTLPPNERVDPTKLRADISHQLNHALSSRTYAHAESCRMLDMVKRHHNRIQIILGKLHVMYDNFPTVEEQERKSPVQPRSPQMTRGPKITLRLDSNGEKMQPRRIIVPGEVLGPHEIDFNVYSDSSEDLSEDEDSVSPPRRPIADGPRIKLVKPMAKTPKQRPPKPARPARSRLDNGPPPVSTSTALAKLKPPPDNAVPGSTDAPWLQLTQYELAKLRKRMKKNSQWIPSDTMIARELRNLGRGVEAFKEAQKKAEEEGRPFEPTLPAPVVDAESGIQHPPEGAISADALTADEVQLSNRGMKLNEAKKLKRETLARMAAEEAEESARKMAEAARIFMNHEASPSVAGSSHDKSQDTVQSQGKASSSKSKGKKRKRESLSATPGPDKPQGTETTTASSTPAPPASQPDKPHVKRTKTETPVPPPQITPRPPSAPPPPTVAAPSHPVETPVPVPQIGRTGLTSKTPVPIPTPITVPSDSSIVAVRTASSSGQTSPAPSTITSSVPVKHTTETPILPPVKTSTTPILPPARDIPKRETRQTMQPAAASLKQQPSSSRSNTPVPVPVPEQALQPVPPRRPGSRGKAASQEPPPTFAADRPRRASTARNTPAPEIRQPSKRAKRPAPGVVTTNPGGTSAIGKRKAAPRKKKAQGKGRKDKGTNQHLEPEMEVEVDDDGNVIDPSEPRYCQCNGVSFGTMIQCDNVDNCEREWFHLECVGLTEIPARTTKWYCPQCRILLHIGGRGEVNSRGVKM